MAHDHDHSHAGTYYVDQLCTIAACGLLGLAPLLHGQQLRAAYVLTGSLRRAGSRRADG